jgi:aminoglycoside phosphotransferase (APT) family kinase protein
MSRALLRSMVYQITEGGVFHADPHPGNVLLLADGRLALLDFGSVGPSTPGSESRCRTCCSHSAAATPRRSATPCSSWSRGLRRSTNSCWSEHSASSWRGT